MIQNTAGDVEILPTWNHNSFPSRNEWDQTGLKNRATITPILTVVIQATNISAPENRKNKQPTQQGKW